MAREMWGYKVNRKGNLTRRSKRKIYRQARKTGNIKILQKSSDYRSLAKVKKPQVVALPAINTMTGESAYKFAIYQPAVRKANTTAKRRQRVHSRAPMPRANRRVRTKRDSRGRYAGSY